ncbi:MAG: metabolite traffic protein EboE [Saprospiraceae bacterium]|nr:metabolite traffic protein EboE [Saprospiraceae bacterium]
MRIDHHQAHLSYCSNIHPGESWEETFANLRNYTTQVRDRLGKTYFGIGLRISNAASLELIQPENLATFKQWLADNQMYVFTVNGFPYGGFHHQVVKDQVHFPDWTTSERLEYTLRLFNILKVLLPEGLDGGVSTSPLSYRFWHATPSDLDRAKEVACKQLVDVAIHLHSIKSESGKSLHLDIEPEPDGIIETSAELIDFYKDYLLKMGVEILQSALDCRQSEAEEIIFEHLQLCYDVCHFAVGFEDPAKALHDILKSGIRIGRIQISAALSSGAEISLESQKQIREELGQFDEPVYLHQAVIRDAEGTLSRYPDLRPALDTWQEHDKSELRTHYHVPIFTEKYGALIPTQKDIVEVLKVWKEQNFTNHLEVETYTWDVLPLTMRTDIVQSVARELSWVIDTLAK